MGGPVSSLKRSISCRADGRVSVTNEPCKEDRSAGAGPRIRHHQQRERAKGAVVQFTTTRLAHCEVAVGFEPLDREQLAQVQTVVMFMLLLKWMDQSSVAASGSRPAPRSTVASAGARASMATRAPRRRSDSGSPASSRSRSEPLIDVNPLALPSRPDLAARFRAANPVTPRPAVAPPASAPVQTGTPLYPIPTGLPISMGQVIPMGILVAPGVLPGQIPTGGVPTPGPMSIPPHGWPPGHPKGVDASAPAGVPPGWPPGWPPTHGTAAAQASPAIPPTGWPPGQGPIGS